MSTVTRFAPSPTGYLHVGGARTALYSWLYAKKNNGKFILRIEDTDLERSTPEAVQAILDGMSWLGMEGDGEIFYQTKRFDLYKEYVQKLLDQEKAYKCYISKERLEELREQSEASGERIDYEAENASIEKNEDTPFVVRFRNPKTGSVKWVDTVRGEMEISNEEMDDMIILRSDGSPTYNFCVVIDDWQMGMTHVIRGEEWLPSLALHQLIYDAFSWTAPEFMHLPLILKPQGKGKLSKRDGEKMGFPVYPLEWEKSKGFKERGFLPEALMNYLALLGWNPGTDEEIFEMGTLEKIFDPERIQKGGAKFDFEKARWINHQFLGFTDKKTVFKCFPEFFDCFPNTWSEKTKNDVYSLLRDRLFLLEDIKKESRLFYEDPADYDTKVLNKIQKNDPRKIVGQFCSLIKEGVAVENWKSEIQLWNESQGLPFGAIMQSLRLAIVGSLNGPDIFSVCKILGNEISLRRLEKFLNHQN